MSVNVLEQSFCKQKKKQHVSSDTFSWYFATFLLASLDSFLFTCAHLPQPSCHGCEHLHRVILDLERKKSVISCLKPKWHLQSSTEGYRVCCAVGGVYVCVCIFTARI